MTSLGGAQVHIDQANAPRASGLAIWDLVSLSAGPAVAYGLSRFAYALLLPPMRADLGLSYAEAGGINTANNAGYFVGALLALFFVTPAKAKLVFVWGLVATGALLMATALFHSFVGILIVRFAGGIPAAMALVAGGTLASHAGGDDKLRSALALNVYYCGGGLGIVLSALAAVPILSGGAYTSWPLAWVILGVTTIVLSVPAALSARKLVIKTQTTRKDWKFAAVLGAGLGPIAMAYFCFGLGYIGYMTFVIAFLRDSAIGGSGIIFFWLMVGIASSLGAFIWTPIFSRVSGAGAIAAVMTTIAIGAAILAGATASLPMITLSAILFGSSFLSVVAAVNYAIRGKLSPEMWASGIAIMTIVVSVGQGIGPILTGWLSEIFGALRLGLITSPLFLILGAACAGFDAARSTTAVPTGRAASH